MTVRVRMAPSPTGFLHIGGVRTFLFNWLFARRHSGECLLRIENTDTSREVAEATEQIQRSLQWLGIDWDGPVTFQLDAMDRCRELARQLLAEEKAYEDEGAIRFRMPDEGVTAWDDAVLGRIEVPSEQLEDVVLVRSDGRPTYNFANPVEDMDDAITHVIRGRDHVSNTPKQLQILAALGHEPPVYAHVPDVLGDDGKKLSKRHGATSVDEFRGAGYVAPALMNVLALLGWAPDGETTIMPPQELVARFSLDRVGGSPATLDYQKLDWMNGVYLRAMTPDEYADALVAYLREQGYEWDERTIRASAPLVQEKIARLGEYPAFAGFFFERRDGEAGGELDAGILDEAADTLRDVEPFNAEAVEAALRSLCDRLEVSPRKGLQPIRIAVTGSKISPGLFESIELLGREETLARISAARAGGA
jgi:glutamyl-tRNA synthetase